jgi:hypothetical protein
MGYVMVGRESASVRQWVDSAGKPRIALDYFGKTSGNETGSEAFVVQAIDRVVEPHFHPVDQFQILLGNRGSLYQRTPIPSIMLHYADAYSTYGPLIGANPPLRFFTLRAKPTRETWYMPKDREHLLYRGKRHFTFDIEQFMAENPLGHGVMSTDAMIEPADDGLAAWIVSVGPQMKFQVPSSSRSSGQYLFVAEGTLDADGTQHPAQSLAWQDPDLDILQLQAGLGGCRLLVLQFPSPATPVAQARFEEAAIAV